MREQTRSPKETKKWNLVLDCISQGSGNIRLPMVLLTLSHTDLGSFVHWRRPCRVVSTGKGPPSPYSGS